MNTVILISGIVILLSAVVVGAVCVAAFVEWFAGRF